MNTRKYLLAAALSVVLGGSVSAASMSASQAQDVLARNGFSNISMLEFESGLWIGTATNVNGELVSVHIDPVSENVTSQPSAKTRTSVTTTTTTTTRPASTTVVKEVPVVVEKVVEKPVVIERVVEQPVVRAPIIIEERIIVPVGGKISKDVVHVVLTDAGYHNIHDIDWLATRGVWKAEARDAQGDDREIHVDPIDARIVHVEDD